LEFQAFLLNLWLRRNDTRVPFRNETIAQTVGSNLKMKFTIKILVGVLMLASTNIIACTCSIPKSLKAIQDYEFENSECIFIGEVIEIDPINSLFQFKVVESFKGEENGTVYTGAYDQICGPIIDKTGNWLIYGNFNDENQVVINHCGLTRSLNSPEDNISATKPPKPPLPNEKETESEIERKMTEWRLRAKSDLENEIKELRKRTE
jgi:hypothetical protein